MNFKIESGIPLPSRRRGIMEEMRQVLRGMKPGQSFVVTKDNKHCYDAAKSIGAKIATRKVDNVGWRVWLVQSGKGNAVS